MNALQIGDVIKVGGVTIIPIEKIDIYSDSISTPLWWYGSKEIYALVILASSGLRAIDKNSRDISIKELFGKVPQLFNALNL